MLSSSCRYSFVGAHAKHIGYFESANRGTLFLDELGELPLGTQTRLLRVLQERVVQRVGGTEVLPVDVRIVAATNRDVDAATAAGTLRKDLLYRLDVVRLTVPPLRSRPDDILPLAERFARGVSRRALIYKMERYGLKEPPKARHGHAVITEGDRGDISVFSRPSDDPARDRASTSHSQVVLHVVGPDGGTT